VLRVTIKGLLARKRRLVTTGIAVVLGIAFLSGTQLLSRTLSASIESLIGDVYDGIDAVVRSADAQESPFGPPIRATVPVDLVERVGTVDGVRAAVGVVEQSGPSLLDQRGKVIGGGFGPPTLTYNWIDDRQLMFGVLTEGTAPTADDEVVLDFQSAADAGVPVGGEVRISTLQAGTEPYRLVGLVGLGEDGQDSSGAKVMFFTTPTAQRLTNQPDQFNWIAVAAADGVGQEELARDLAAALPGSQVLTGEAFTIENQESISQFVDVLGTFVTVFGFIALFVATFIIYNTFSIIVAQRTRETALLRALGARRRQVLAATIIEALVIGLVASVLGLAFGVLLSTVLIWLVGNFFTVQGGVSAPGPGVIAQAFAIGVGITVLSAFIPALRASKIPPIAALQEAGLDRSDVSTARKVWGTLLLVGGIVLIGLGLANTGDNPLLLVGAGAAAVLLSVAVILGPLIAAPVSRGLALPFRAGGRVTGRLAGENAARNPRRTAATAAALTIGVSLVTVIAVVANSVKTSADQTISSAVQADYVVATTDQFSIGAIPADTLGRIEALPDVAVASPVRFSPMLITDAAARAKQARGESAPPPPGLAGALDAAPPGDSQFVLGIEPSTWFEVIDNGDLQGDPADLGPDTLAASAAVAEERGWRLGDVVPVWFPGTGARELRLTLTFDRTLGQIGLYLPLSTFEANALPVFNVDNQIYVKAAEGASLVELRRQLDDAVADVPTVSVQDLGEFLDAQTAPIDTFLRVIYALLGLAVLIALIGITNTLSLSVLERTRELGLLRAVGMTREQLRRTIRLESAIIAVFGTLIGLVIGIAFSIALTVAISAETPNVLVFDLPEIQLVVFALGAAVAGVLAALLPSERAARMDVLAAVASE
jgi:putative ABC transport system permease protein